MLLFWSTPALSDLACLHDFLAPKNRRAATQMLRTLRVRAGKLAERPRLGERVDKFDAAEVRRIFVADYELRYEMKGETFYVLNVWHTREER